MFWPSNLQPHYGNVRNINSNDCRTLDTINIFDVKAVVIQFSSYISKKKKHQPDFTLLLALVLVLNNSGGKRQAGFTSQLFDSAATNCLSVLRKQLTSVSESEPRTVKFSPLS